MVQLVTKPDGLQRFFLTERTDDDVLAGVRWFVLAGIFVDSIL